MAFIAVYVKNSHILVMFDVYYKKCKRYQNSDRHYPNEESYST